MSAYASFSCFPSPTQTLVLKAALLHDERALEAWHTWTARVDILTDPIDGGSFRLLPLVYRNLTSLGADDASLARLRGIHRRTWCENQVRLRSLAHLLSRFQEAGIATLVLKGAALALRYYDDVGLRPMDDVDILVPWARVQESIDLLYRLGWREKPHRDIRRVTRALLDVRHSWSFENKDGENVDLHWHALATSCFPGADDAFWHDAEPLLVNGVPTLTLNPTDALLHVCVHGSRWNALPPIRWVSDAWMILQVSSNRIVWQRLLDLAEWLGATLPLRDSLGYLANTFEAPIPPEVVEQLGSAPLSVHGRHAYALHSAYLDRPFQVVAYLWHGYLHYCDLWMKRTASKPPVSLLTFAQVHTGWLGVYRLMRRVVAVARRHLQPCMSGK